MTTCIRTQGVHSTSELAVQNICKQWKYFVHTLHKNVYGNFKNFTSILNTFKQFCMGGEKYALVNTILLSLIS